MSRALFLLCFCTNHRLLLCPSSRWAFSLEYHFSHNLHPSLQEPVQDGRCQVSLNAFRPSVQGSHLYSPLMAGPRFFLVPMPPKVLTRNQWAVCVELVLLSLIKHGWLTTHSILITDSYIEKTAGGSKSRVKAYRINTDHLKKKEKSNRGSSS